MGERRRAERVHVQGGSAICRGSKGSEFYEVRNMSRGGTCLAGATLRLGETVELETWWPQVGAAELSARVVRAPSNTHEIGLEFSSWNREISRLLTDLKAIAELHQNYSSTLIYSRNKDFGQHWVAQLEAEGCPAFHAQTTLDAIERLDDPWEPVGRVLVEPTPQGIEFANFLIECRPEIERGILDDKSLACQRAVSAGMAGEFILPGTNG